MFSRIRWKILTFFFERANQFFSRVLLRKETNLIVSVNPAIQRMSTNKQKDWAVIYQGKIYSTDFFEFLSESIKLTRNVNPEIEIIVATYNDGFSEELAKHSRILDFTIVTVTDVGSMPAGYPPSLCQQIVSSAKGIEAAQKMGFSKCLKVRVDQRIDVASAIDLAETLSKKLDNVPLEMSPRIWGSSYNSYKYRPLGLSDMFHMGSTKAMSAYWKSSSIEELLEDYLSIRAINNDYLWSNFDIPETFLAARYLVNQGESVTEASITNKVFWIKYAGILNAVSISHIWHKTFPWLGSNYHTIKWFNRFFSKSFAEMTFEQWLLFAKSDHSEKEYNCAQI